MSFFLGSAARRAAPPFGIEMLGAAKPPLRNSPPPLAAPNLRRTRAAGQKAGFVLLRCLYLFYQHRTARRKRHIACGELFHWGGKPPALPVEVPRKKALASSIERSELLTANYQ